MVKLGNFLLRCTCLDWTISQLFQILPYKTLALQVTNLSPFDQSEATFEMSCGTVTWIITFSVFWYEFLAYCYVGARYTRWLYHVIQFLLVGYITSYPCFPRFVCGAEPWIPRAKPILHTNYKVPEQVRANTHIQFSRAMHASGFAFGIHASILHTRELVTDNYCT